MKHEFKIWNSTIPASYLKAFMRHFFIFLCMSIAMSSCHWRRPPDIATGKLTYCHFIGMVSPEFRNEKEFVTELAKYKIDYRTEVISDVITDQTPGCYCDFMIDKIRSRYGTNFIDSLLNVSDSIYLSTRINDTISFMDCDSWPRYPGDADTTDTEESSVFQKQCDSSLKYPVGYNRRHDFSKSAFVNVDFIINKAGAATIAASDFLFDEPGNNKYEAYFRRQIAKIAKRVGWAPAQIRKHKVVSEYTLRVYLK